MIKWQKYQIISEETKKMNEKNFKDNKTILEINDFFTWCVEIENSIFEPCLKGDFVAFRLGFEVPEHIAPVCRWS